MGKDIENFVSNCSVCTRVNFKPVIKETLPWPQAKFPFERIHIDFFQFERTLFFICVDSFSKWCHVSVLSSTTADAVSEQLLFLFSQWGFPTKIVSDNGLLSIQTNMSSFALILTSKLSTHLRTTQNLIPLLSERFKLLKKP